MITEQQLHRRRKVATHCVGALAIFTILLGVPQGSVLWAFAVVCIASAWWISRSIVKAEEEMWK